MTLHLTRSPWSWAAAALLATVSLSSFAATGSHQLNLYVKSPQQALHATVVTSGGQQVLAGESASVGQPDAPGGSATVRRSGKNDKADALTLQWANAWYAGLRLEGDTALDLRPYLKQGVLALDLNVVDLAKAGLSFKVNCGNECEQKIPFMLPARAMGGKGWQHVVFPMRCFIRDGADFSAVTQALQIDTGGSGEIAVANVKLLKSGKPNASCPDFKTVSVTPDMLNESWAIDWWLPRHLAKLAEIKRRKDNNEATDLVFIGDSITEGWEKGGKPVFERNYTQYKALALGFGGDRTENVLWRLQHGEVDGIAPKVAVLMFGTNNTGHRRENPALIAAGVKRNLDELRKRLPNTKILLLAIFPRDEKPGTVMRINNEKASALIANYADQQHIFFLDINKSFLDADGNLSKDIMPDLLHPNEKGYEIWAQAMNPALLELMK